MTHPDTKHMLELVEQQTGYRVSVDLISGIHEHAQMISARTANPVHMIRVNATQRFHALGEEQAKAITFEVAMLGRSGFDINSPDKKYTLKSLPGHFSGLHLVSMMYVGMKSMAPTTDVGIDLSKEYAEAKRLFALEK